jgi:hypothetical protein
MTLYIRDQMWHTRYLYSILHVICLMKVQTKICNKDQDSEKERVGEER